MFDIIPLETSEGTPRDISGGSTRAISVSTLEDISQEIIERTLRKKNPECISVEVLK